MSDKVYSLEKLKQNFNSDEWPEFLSLSQNENRVEIEVIIGLAIRWFEGHFPEQPVLAGVVQTHWAALLSAYFFPLQGEFSRLDNLKFQNVILPEVTLTIALEHQVEKNSVKFRFVSEDESFSEGRIVYQAKIAS